MVAYDVGGHGGIAAGQILADDVGAGEVVKEAADPAPATGRRRNRDLG
jgi:hypothetical protein